MPVITVASVPKKKAKSYPKIMKSSMYTVLFKSAGTGTILSVHSKDAGWDVGDGRSSIPMNCYTEYNEPVTIQNK